MKAAIPILVMAAAISVASAPHATQADAASAVPPVIARMNFADMHYSTVQVRDGLHVLLSDDAPNTLAFLGEEGAFLVDSTYAQLTGPWTVQLDGIVGDLPLRMVVVTHWHPDHTGQLEQLAARGATVVSHANARRRMARPHFSQALRFSTPALPPQQMPALTYEGRELVHHFNGDVIRILHPPSAHTNGDSIVHFQKANVVHMGDIFFHRKYPLVDLEAGGSFAGVITAVDEVLALCDAATVIVPGHGPLATRADLEAYRDALVALRSEVRARMLEGKTAEEIAASEPAALSLPVWKGWRIVTASRLVHLVFNDLVYNGDFD